jgi:hypothetical protein
MFCYFFSLANLSDFATTFVAFANYEHVKSIGADIMGPYARLAMSGWKKNTATVPIEAIVLCLLRLPSKKRLVDIFERFTSGHIPYFAVIRNRDVNTGDNSDSAQDINIAYTYLLCVAQILAYHKVAPTPCKQFRYEQLFPESDSNHQRIVGFSREDWSRGLFTFATFLNNRHPKHCIDSHFFSNQDKTAPPWVASNGMEETVEDIIISRSQSGSLNLGMKESRNLDMDMDDEDEDEDLDEDLDEDDDDDAYDSDDVMDEAEDDELICPSKPKNIDRLVVLLGQDMDETSSPRAKRVKLSNFQTGDGKNAQVLLSRLGKTSASIKASKGNLVRGNISKSSVKPRPGNIQHRGRNQRRSTIRPIAPKINPLPDRVVNYHTLDNVLDKVRMDNSLPVARPRNDITDHAKAHSLQASIDIFMAMNPTTSLSEMNRRAAREKNLPEPPPPTAQPLSMLLDILRGQIGCSLITPPSPVRYPDINFGQWLEMDDMHHFIAAQTNVAEQVAVQRQSQGILEADSIPDNLQHMSHAFELSSLVSWHPPKTVDLCHAASTLGMNPENWPKLAINPHVPDFAVMPHQAAGT